MKTIIKLIFFGAVTGLTVKFLNEKNVNIVEIALEIIRGVEERMPAIDPGATGNYPTDESIMTVPEGPAGHGPERPGASRYEHAGGEHAVVEQTGGEKSETSPGHSMPDDSPAETRRMSQVSEPRPDLTGKNDNDIGFPIPQQKDEDTSRLHEMDRHAASIHETLSGEMDVLVRYLTRPARNDLEKTRAIFTWIALNVGYDDDGFNTGHYGDLSAEGVFRVRRAVCRGFSELFREMGERAGLEIILVTGYAKGIGCRQGEKFNDTDHAWNLVRIDNRWRLFDVTWAEGYGTAYGGKLISVREFDEYWFGTPPAEFIFTHLPEDPRWQLTDRSISKSQWEYLPYAGPSFFRMGFDGPSCLRDALDGTFRSFPKCYKNDGSILSPANLL